MATQSDSRIGGYKRLSKSARETRSPIRTRSRSRILDQQEQPSVSYSNTPKTETQSLKRKHLKPVTSSKKLKTKNPKKSTLKSDFEKPDNKSPETTNSVSNKREASKRKKQDLNTLNKEHSCLSNTPSKSNSVAEENQVEKSAVHSEKIPKSKIDNNSTSSELSDKPKIKSEENCLNSDLTKPNKAKTTGSCTSSRNRRSSRTTKLPTTSTSALGGGSSRQAGARGRGGMSTVENSQEVVPNRFSCDGSSAFENIGNVAASSGMNIVSSLASAADSESEDSEMGRLQALLEARGLPPHLFGALGSRMQHMLHRSIGTTACNRAHQLLQGLQATGDEGQQLQAVMEMCQLLVMGNEDTLSGFPVKQVVPVLIGLLSMEHNFDMMNHACRALTYMMEALPRSSAIVVDAIPIFLEKLQIIQCMDVAEQSLTALDMLSRRHSKAILHARGVPACLMYLDFFSINAQRAALSITANCCQNISCEEFNLVQDSLPLLSSRLTHQDKKSVESVCMAFSRLIDCFQHDPKCLTEIAAYGLLSNIQQLLVVSPSIISSGIFVTVLHMLALMCAACPELAVLLLKQNISETLRCLLMVPSDSLEELDLIPRSPQELFEITSLIGELMPRLPSGGIFSIDFLIMKQNYNHLNTGIWQWRDDKRLWHPYTSIDNKIIEAAHQSGEDEISLSAMGKTYTIDFNSMTQINEDSGTTRSVQRHLNNISGFIGGSIQSMDSGDSRVDCLQENSHLAASCIKLLFPVLYEVYSSSAGPAVRHKCLRALLRMIYFAPSDLLQTVLKYQTVSSHVAAMLASQDLRIVVSALQMAEIIMQKLPEIFGIYFRREGVMHQVRWLASIDISSDSSFHPKLSTSDSMDNIPPLPALIPINSPTDISCDSDHSTFISNTSPVSACDLSSDNAMHFPGGSSWNSSSVALSFEKIHSSTHAESSTDELNVDSISQVKINDALKRKRTLKRNTTNRKPYNEEASVESANSSNVHGVNKGSTENHINPVLGSSMLTLPGCSPVTSRKFINTSPVLGGASNSASCSNNSSLAATPGKGKFSFAAAKTSSFLANLNPARWGRWSSNPTVSGNVQETNSAQQSSIRINTNGNREKIRIWIKEQAKKFDEEFFRNEHPGLLHPAMSILSSLTTALENLKLMVDGGLKALVDIRTVVIDSDISSFEVIHSGLVKNLLLYLTSDSGSSFSSIPRNDRLRNFLNVFVGTPLHESSNFDPSHLDNSAYLALVWKLNACIGQLEQFSVKVHDLPGAGQAGSRGTTALKFLNTHQLKCNLQRHPSCSNLRQWHGGPVKIDPLALVQAIERYLVIRGYGRIKDEDEASEDENSDDDIDDTMAAMMINQGQGQHKLQFTMGDNVLPYNMTVYQAVRQYGELNGHFSESQDIDSDTDNPMGHTDIWVQTHTIWYRPILTSEMTSHCANKLVSNSTCINLETQSDSSHRLKGTNSNCMSPKKKCEDAWNDGLVSDVLSPLSLYLVPKLPASVTVRDPSLEVINLLRVIHSINIYWGSLYQMKSWGPLVSQIEFLNSKLTAKANRQLQDPLAIMTGNVPVWLSQIAYACPFLFPFESRHLLFYVTSFDRDRALQRLLDTSPEMSSNDSGERVTPRLDRRKRTVSRDDLLKQAETIMQDLGSSKALLEIQYENEVGTGLGPTLEFYALVSKELQRHDLDMWRGEKIEINMGKDSPVSYIFCPSGLFPMPLGRNAKLGLVTKVRSKFKFLGKFLAKALMDSRMLDIPLNIVFYKWMLNQENYLSLADLKYIDESISQTILKLEQLSMDKKKLLSGKFLNPSTLNSALERLTLDGCQVEDLNLDFTVPGFSHIEMRKGGKDMIVTIHNLEEYLKLVRFWIINEGVRRQMEAFREGFESVFSLNQLKIFYPDEMEYLFCGSGHNQWDIKSLIECCRPDHGYTHDSRAIKFLFEILSEYKQSQQRQFVQFVTGSPRLPVGGLKSLSPPLTVVRKTLDVNDDTNEYLPSVMTCVNYLKLPDYSTIEIMREKLHIAVSEGQHSFHLS